MTALAIGILGVRSQPSHSRACFLWKKRASHIQGCSRIERGSCIQLCAYTQPRAWRRSNFCFSECGLGVRNSEQPAGRSRAGESGAGDHTRTDREAVTRRSRLLLAEDRTIMGFMMAKTIFKCSGSLSQKSQKRSNLPTTELCYACYVHTRTY